MKTARIALAWLLVGAATATAADVSPEARKALDDVARAYKALNAYADKGQVSILTKADAVAKTTRHVVPSQITLARPNRLAIDAGVVRIVSDGTSLRTIVSPLSMYRDVPAPARIGLDDLRDGPLGAVISGSPQGRPLGVILSFLLDEDPVKGMVDEARSIKIQTLGDLWALTYEPQVGPNLVMSIDKARGLITAMTIELKSKPGEESAIPGSSLVVEQLSWSAGAVETKAVPDATFTMTRPEGYTEIAKLAKDVARKKAEHELVDQPAPDFTLTILDGPGKTRHVTKADLAGKVVLLDFWATWCGPCLTELPDIQKLIADYAKAKKPVVVVAVSIDQADDGDVDEVRALVEKTLKEKEIFVQVAPVGSVALDPSATIARAYKAQAIPQLVVIDAKGNVRHVHVGVTERHVLIEEIDGLLGEAVKP